MQLIYLDDHLAIINKPSGLLAHRSNIDRHETRFALQELRNHLGKRVYLVHRLDKPTSGVMLFALDPDTAKTMMLRFAERRVDKTYLAVVRGFPETTGPGIVDHPLNDPEDAYIDTLTPKTEATAKPAVTAYSVLALGTLPVAVGPYPSARYALVQIEPHTGRRHQIRRHMKHIAHPIIGDTTYGQGTHNRVFRDIFGSRLLLHAARLSFSHPVDERAIVVTAPLDPIFQAVVERFSWQQDLPAGVFPL